MVHNISSRKLIPRAFLRLSCGIYISNIVRTISKVVVPLGTDELILETGKLARFADGCAVAQLGNTAVMVTSVSRSRQSSSNFVPLTVDYRQKAAAGGRIPTNFLRRELGPSDQEILTSRLIDRSIRPLFPKTYFRDTQVACNLLSVDGVNDPDVVSINAASAALALSDIPWNGPIGAVRIGYIGEEIVVNPTRKQLQNSRLNLVLSGSCTVDISTGAKSRRILMVEMSAEDLPAAEILKCVKVGLNSIGNITSKILELQHAAGKAKREVTEETANAGPSEAILKGARLLAESSIRAIYADSTHDKISRDAAISEVRKDVVEKLAESFPDEVPAKLESAVSEIVRDIFRDMIFETEIRCDGRKLGDLRPVNSEVDLYKPLHGSSLFQRGQTQVLCTVTFDSQDSAFRSDPMSVLTGALKEKSFMLHYEFPPYAVNEVSTGRWFGRRELGHSVLAEKALRPVIPKDFPFTIRLTSEVLESNGSSSMATVCGGSLALMDSGVPILAPVAGVAIGLVTRKDSDEISDYRLLTDISGIEDYMGDMDFKIAGSNRGFTAIQLDLKIPGIPTGIFNESIKLAVKSKKDLLKIMSETLKYPRSEIKQGGPVTETVEIPVQKRSRFVGLGGYNLKKIQAEAGVQITACEENKFLVFAPNREAMLEAKEHINRFLEEQKEPVLEFGAIYTGKIVEVRDWGVMVILYPNMNPVLVPNSQLDQRRIGHPSALGLEVGGEISVKYFGRDPSTGHARLSRKVLQTTMPPGTRHLLQQKDSTTDSPWSTLMKKKVADSDV